MRIWHQGLIPEAGAPDYYRALRDHARRIARPDTEVVFHGLDPKTYEGAPSVAEVVKYNYLMSLHVQQILENARQAEEEGYDAVAITIIQNPGLREARSLVDIPVTGYGEAAMHLACMLGDRFSVVAFNEDLFPLFAQNIRDYGLENRAGPMAIMQVDYAAVMNALRVPGPVVDSFTKAAREVIAGGAQALIPGQTLLAEVLWQAGIFRVDEVPVVDALGAAVKVAELLVDLRHTSGLGVNRRGYYWARPPAPFVDHARRMYGFTK
ncbi:MAG: hypothetical protein HY329_05935 [Chloroflexi bacterium]|nr:hypothetical protein [Chloroflexota bacterium]